MRPPPTKALKWTIVPDVHADQGRSPVSKQLNSAQAIPMATTGRAPSFLFPTWRSGSWSNRTLNLLRLWNNWSNG